MISQKGIYAFPLVFFFWSGIYKFLQVNLGSCIPALHIPISETLKSCFPFCWLNLSAGEPQRWGMQQISLTNSISGITAMPLISYFVLATSFGSTQGWVVEYRMGTRFRFGSSCVQNLVGCVSNIWCSILDRNFHGFLFRDPEPNIPSWWFWFSLFRLYIDSIVFGGL